MHPPHAHDPSRRAFLRFSAGTTVAAAGAALPGCATAGESGLAPARFDANATGARVVMRALPAAANVDEVEAAARDAIEELGGLGWLSRGDKVLIKPASNSANRYPVTRPVLVTAVARTMKKEGAGRVVMADHPGVATVHHERDGSKKGSTRATFAENGLLTAAQLAEADVHGFEEPGYDAFFASKASQENWKGPLMLPNIVGEVDHIVYLNRVSAHVLAGATLALKNAVGWIREDSRLELHRDGATFLEKCAEINAAPEILDRTRLVMSDATEVQTTIGPDFGYAARMEPPLLIATKNLAMHDVAAYNTLMYAREQRTPWWAFAVDPYPRNASWMNHAFVGMSWGVGEATDYTGYDAPARGRGTANRVIRRGVELFSPAGARPDLFWVGEVPTEVRSVIGAA